MPMLRPLLIVLVLACSAAADESATKLRLEIELIDGSRLFAEPAEAKSCVGLRSRVGDVTVPLAELAHFELQSDQETIVVQWPTGDRLTGAATTADLDVHTALGRMQIPLATLRRCKVQVIAADRPIKPAGVSASGAWSHQQPGNVLDGDVRTVWSSGAYSGWIELDLGANYQLASIRVVIQASPNGLASHGFYVSDKPMRANVTGGRLVKSFSGDRHDDEVLATNCDPGTVGRYVQVRCTGSVSWFNLKEIEVLPRL